MILETKTECAQGFEDRVLEMEGRGGEKLRGLVELGFRKPEGETGYSGAHIEHVVFKT